MLAKLGLGQLRLVYTLIPLTLMHPNKSVNITKKPTEKEQHPDLLRGIHKSFRENGMALFRFSCSSRTWVFGRRTGLHHKLSCCLSTLSKECAGSAHHHGLCSFRFLNIPRGDCWHCRRKRSHCQSALPSGPDPAS
jgi:hypothetical protein